MGLTGASTSDSATYGAEGCCHQGYSVSFGRSDKFHEEVTGGGLSSVMAWVASLAVAEVASSADFALVTSPAELAGMAFLAVSGVASPADFAGMAIPAVAGAAPLAVVEVAYSSDSMEAACSPSGCSSWGTSRRCLVLRNAVEIETWPAPGNSRGR